MKVIIITGMPASGKGVLNQVASAKFNIPVYGMGDRVREDAKELGVPSDKLGILAGKMRAIDPLYWAKRTVEVIRKDNPEIVIIDGSRSLYECEYFKQELAECVIVAVHANPKLREERTKSRGREDINEGFLKRDKRELSWGIGSVIASADYMLINENKSIEEFEKEAEELFNKILNS